MFPDHSGDPDLNPTESSLSSSICFAHYIAVLSYLALTINGFVSKSVWAKGHVFLQYPHGPSLPKESRPVLPTPFLESPAGPRNLSLLPRAEGQLGVTRSQGHTALGSPRRALAPLGPFTVHRALGAKFVWLATVCEKDQSVPGPARSPMSPECCAKLCVVPRCYG